MEMFSTIKSRNLVGKFEIRPPDGKTADPGPSYDMSRNPEHCRYYINIGVAAAISASRNVSTPSIVLGTEAAQTNHRLTI